MAKNSNITRSIEPPEWVNKPKKPADVVSMEEFNELAIALQETERKLRECREDKYMFAVGMVVVFIFACFVGR